MERIGNRFADDCHADGRLSGCLLLFLYGGSQNDIGDSRHHIFICRFGSAHDEFLCIPDAWHDES